MKIKETHSGKQSISASEAEQYRHDMLSEVVSLPTQSEVTLTDEMLDTDFWPDLEAANFINYSHYATKKACPTLREYLETLSAPAGVMTSTSDIELYYFVSLRFGFRPTVAASANLLGAAMKRDEVYSDQGLDVSEVDELVQTHFGTALNYEEIGLRASSIDAFKEAGIRTVGDFVMHASIERMKKRFGMSPAPLKRVADFIEREYGINRNALKSHPAMRETLKIRYAVIRAAQAETE